MSAVEQRPADPRLGPPLTDAAPAGRRWRLRLHAPAAGTLLAAFLVALATAAQLGRQPGTPGWDSLWQEDGNVFFTNALQHSLWHDLWQPYNDYLHWAPRVIAHVAALFPLDYTAIVMNGLDCLVVALVSLYVFHASAAVFRTTWARFAMAAAPIVLPVTAFETNGNITNLHWYLMYGAFWACVANPRTRGALVAAAVIVWFAVMSDASTIALLPLLLVQMARARDWRRPSAWVLPLLFIAGFALQYGFALSVQPSTRYSDSHWAAIVPIYGLRVAGSLLVGDNWIDNLWRSFGHAFTWLSIVVVALIGVYALARRRDAPTRVFVVACGVYSVVLMTASLMLRGTGLFLNRASFTLGGARYMVIPVLLLLAIVLVALEQRDARVRLPRRRALQIGVAAWAAVVVLGGWAIPSTRSNGPSWKQNLAAARAKCDGRLLQDTPQVVSAVRRPTASDQVIMFVSPFVYPRSPWGVTATCRQIQWRY